MCCLSTLIAYYSYHPITCEFSNSALSCKSFHINCRWLISSDHLWIFKQCVVFPHSLHITNFIRSLLSFQTVRRPKNLSIFIADWFQCRKSLKMDLEDRTNYLKSELNVDVPYSYLIPLYIHKEVKSACQEWKLIFGLPTSSSLAFLKHSFC